MTKFNFTDDDKVMPDPTPVPTGDYAARCIGCELSRVGPASVEKWHLVFSILEGDHQNREVHDDIFWTQKAAPRAYLMLSKLLMDNDAQTPEEKLAAAEKMMSDFDTNNTPLVVGRKCVITVFHENFQTKSGETRKKAVVGYRGYRALCEATDTNPDDYSDIPF